MKRTKLLMGILCLAAAFCGCKKVTDLKESTAASSTRLTTNSGPIDTVKIVNQSGTWKLLVNNTEFFIKGGAADNKIYNSYWFNIYAYHGNSIRVYSVNDATQALLDSAQIHGIKVTLCLSLVHPEFGFDYGDHAKVDSQYNAQIHWVDKYKNHPAVLMWAIGNELDSNYGTVTNHLSVWNAVADISAYIHTNDPAHPTSTILAGADTAAMNAIAVRAPHLNCIGINDYGVHIADANAMVLASHIDKPYYFGEYGPNGTWFTTIPKTSYGSLIEESSTDKANDYYNYYTTSIGPEQHHACLGGYAFLWGYLPSQSVKSTDSLKKAPTWFGMRSFNSRAFGALEKLQQAWTGSFSGNHAPVIASSEIHWGSYTKTSGPTLSPGTALTASISASDPDGDTLSYEWSVVREGAQIKSPTTIFASDSKCYPSSYNLFSVPTGASTSSSSTIKAPMQVGNYRLYCFVTDGASNHVASACLSFRVQ